MVEFEKLLTESQEERQVNRLIWERERKEAMAKVEKSPEYIKGGDIKGKSKVVFKILDEFKIGGDYGRLQGTAQVISGTEKFKALWSPSKSVGNQLIDMWGDDTVEWMGNEVETRHVEKNGFDVIELAQETL